MNRASLESSRIPRRINADECHLTGDPEIPHKPLIIIALSSDSRRPNEGDLSIAFNCDDFVTDIYHIFVDAL